MTKINIIVLNWNQPTLSLSTINSLLKITTKGFNYHIYLVDNGSTDNSLSIFYTHLSQNNKITILQTKENLGYVGGNNFGIKNSDNNTDYYLLCNNDVVVDKNFLYELLNTAKSNSKPSILGPKIYFESGFEYYPNRYQKKDLGKVIWSAGGYMDWKNIIGSNIGIDQVDHQQFNQTRKDIDFISGCCLLVNKIIVDKIGLLDDSYFMYLEDTDYCQKARLSGFDLIYVPKSIIWHLNAKSSGSGSSLHDYFLSRNRLLFGFKYASLRTKIALLKESFRILLFSTSSWQKKGILDYYFRRLNRGSWNK